MDQWEELAEEECDSEAHQNQRMRKAEKEREARDVKEMMRYE